MSALLLPALAASSSGQGALYVDDVFSTYLYTGNGSTQTINNGIDLVGEGGLVWIKNRVNTSFHNLVDTVRGSTKYLFSNSTDLQQTATDRVTSFLSNGFILGSGGGTNQNTDSYTSWTFRRAPKFFDVVTYTGNGVAGRQIAYSLGAQAGFITVKATSATGDWNSYHRSATGDLKLNLTNAQTASRAIITAADASTFTVSGVANTNGVGYVAYLWAHDPSADGIIQCGSYTGNGSTTGPIVTLGQEPQYLMIKNASGTGNWQIIDSMRGMPVGSADATLQANLSNVESSVDYVSPTATGFQVTSTSGEVNTDGLTYIYLAIRRPNKPPTSGAQVYETINRLGTGVAATINTSFPLDAMFHLWRNGGSHTIFDRLRGNRKTLGTTETSAENGVYNDHDPEVDFVGQGGQTQINWPGTNWNNSGSSNNLHLFRRAPCFFDVVCDSGTGVAHAIAHNLAKAPELIIRKSRSTTTQWEVWHSALVATEKLVLSSNAAKVTDATAWNSTLPTATQFTVGAGANVNANAATFVTYLFATLAGISKVGSYTGNGTSQTIDCCFSTGARFFLVKATSTTGSWWVYDSARGIVSAADPALQLNSTAAEITSADAVDPASVGIIVNQEATCSINATGVSYIFLAIA